MGIRTQVTLTAESPSGRVRESSCMQAGLQLCHCALIISKDQLCSMVRVSLVPSAIGVILCSGLVLLSIITPAHDYGQDPYKLCLSPHVFLFLWPLIFFVCVPTCLVMSSSLWTRVARQAPLSMGFFFQARILEWVAIFLLQGIFLTQGSNTGLLHLLHWQADSLLLSHLGSPNKKSVMVFCSLPGLRGQEQHHEGIWQGTWMWASWPASFISPITCICMQSSIIQIQVWGGKYFLVFWGNCPRSHSQGLDGMTLEASSLLLWSRDSFRLSSFLKFPEREESTNPKEYKSPWH